MNHEHTPELLSDALDDVADLETVNLQLAHAQWDGTTPWDAFELAWFAEGGAL